MTRKTRSWLGFVPVSVSIALVACAVACGGGYALSAGGAQTRAPAGSAESVGHAPRAPSVAAEPASSPSVATGGEVTVTVETHGAAATEQQAIIAQRQVDYALLTAASVGDHDRRANYLGYLARHPSEAREIELDMTRRLRIRVTDDYGRPVHDARVEVTPRQGGHEVVLGRTHADGIWDFHPGVSAPQSGRFAEVCVRADQARMCTDVGIPSRGDAEVPIRMPASSARPPTTLDLGFLVDGTGSMGDELRYVHEEIAAIVARVRAEAPEARVRVGAVFYRDRTDAAPLQRIAFTEDVDGFAAAMRGVQANGGGDYPEDMNAGLELALRGLGWSQGPAARTLVLVADAPPKRYADAQYTYRHALEDAAARGIRILPVAASSANRTVEYLFRAMGAFTSTPYVYLTDDSGVGNPHLEADTDRVAVEYFGDLLVRMLTSELRGEGMHEPGVFRPQTPSDQQSFRQEQGSLHPQDSGHRRASFHPQGSSRPKG